MNRFIFVVVFATVPACEGAIGTFQCGPNACSVADEYCEEFSGGASDDVTYTCELLPSACSDGGDVCACLEDEGILGGADCAVDDQGGATVTINAP
jgi:hypothetical protein